MTGPDGKTKHSWRVAILPYLGQSSLYEQYRLDEPWDSEHNKQVMKSMPAVFRSPTEPADTTSSAYYAIVGDETMFEPNGDGVRVEEITDGVSKTILLVKANREVPWTKPEDIPYSVNQPLPEFGGYFEGIISAAFADGSVRAISEGIDRRVLRSLIEKSDGGRGTTQP